MTILRLFRLQPADVQARESVVVVVAPEWTELPRSPSHRGFPFPAVVGAAAWWTLEVQMEARSKRFGFTLPDELRKIEVLPGTGAQVAVIAMTETLEVRDAKIWLPGIREIVGRLDELRGKLVERLGNR